MSEQVISPYVTSRRKRRLDLACVAASAVPATAMAGLFAGAHRVLHGAPTFFMSERVGQHDQRLRVPKLRTMDGEDTAEAGYTEMERMLGVDDSHRITPTGELMRRTKIDELPQLLLVARGVMSMVGPRVMTRDDRDYHFRVAKRHGGRGLTEDYTAALDILKPAAIDVTGRTKTALGQHGDRAILNSVLQTIDYLHHGTIEDDRAAIGRTVLQVISLQTRD